jgi:hypothetical protein
MQTAAIKAAGLNFLVGSLVVIGSHLQEFQPDSVNHKATVSDGPEG